MKTIVKCRIIWIVKCRRYYLNCQIIIWTVGRHKTLNLIICFGWNWTSLLILQFYSLWKSFLMPTQVIAGMFSDLERFVCRTFVYLLFKTFICWHLPHRWKGYQNVRWIKNANGRKVSVLARNYGLYLLCVEGFIRSATVAHLHTGSSSAWQLLTLLNSLPTVWRLWFVSSCSFCW